MGKTDEVRAVEALVAAAPVMVGVAIRAVEQLTDEVSLAQFRLLRAVAELGPAPSGAVADRLGLVGSSVTRLADKLEDSGHLRRRRERPNRSVVHLELTASGQALVDRTLTAQRRELLTIVGRLSTGTLAHTAVVLNALVSAASDKFETRPRELYIL